MARSLVLLVAAACALSAPGVFAQAGTCFPPYTCMHTFNLLGFNYDYDLSSLCNDIGEYSINDQQGHTYHFNICGNAQAKCLPATYTSTYEYGVTVQDWGATPNCTVPGCEDPMTGDPVCCTKDCEVLGVDAPFWELLDPNNPIDGGLKLAHKGAPPTQDDPFWCPPNPVTGAQYERRVDYVFHCDRTAGNLIINYVSVNATNKCHHTIDMTTAVACACQPQCNNRQCGADGCDGICGYCDLGKKCVETATSATCCAPNCKNKNCGSDGCGGSCGTCPNDYVCSTDHICNPSSYNPAFPNGQPPSTGGIWAGAFFLGLFVTLFVMGGVYYVRTRGIGGFGGGGGSGGGYSQFQSAGAAPAARPAGGYGATVDADL